MPPLPMLKRTGRSLSKTMSRAICVARSPLKFAGKNLSRYRTIFNIVLISAGCGAVTYVAGNFLLHSPKVLLLKPEQVAVTGNHIVSREAVLAPFYKDRWHSVLRIPLDTRRADVEKISWVQSASVQRILP